MSDPLTLKVRRLHGDARLPTKAHNDDAGWDLRAIVACETDGGVVRVPTGIACELPAGWYAQIRGRSSHAGRGVIVLAGVIDPSFRGEWIVCLWVPKGAGIYIIQPGDKVAQFTLHEVPAAIVVEVDELGVSERGSKGFGSSGR